MIGIVFTKSNLIGSKWIREASADEGENIEYIPSHCAWVFFRRLVLEAVLTRGFRINYIKTLKKENDILGYYEYDSHEVTRQFVVMKMQNILDKFHGLGYDYMGVLFQGWRILLNRFFNIPIPDENKWESNNRLSCQEAFTELTGEDYSMTTPRHFQKMILSRNDFRRVEL